MLKCFDIFMHILNYSACLCFDICIPAKSFFAGQIEVTLNGGRHWRLANIIRPEPIAESGKQWCWVFWSCEIPLDALAGSAEICARAWDDSQNCMPALPTWNLMGMMNNPWFRVKAPRAGLMTRGGGG